MAVPAGTDSRSVLEDTPPDSSSALRDPEVSFDTHPGAYKHWRLELHGRIARLILAVREDRGIVPGYELKLNSYDLGVDIELNDAIQRLRFEHPEVGAVIITGGLDRVFCAGANIRMLAASSHEWKVNFCKFTNETRNAIEDATAHSGQTYIAAVNGTAAGGGYELALACDQIILVDDGSSAVSLPEVPLLGVLPGTGGLTRLGDKRQVRRDLADVFATKAEGVRGQAAVDWGLVDEAVPRSSFEQIVEERALAAAARSSRPASAKGIVLEPLARKVSQHSIEYQHISVELDPGMGIATVLIRGPGRDAPEALEEVHHLGSSFWPLALARELEDVILRLRLNEPRLGTWVFRSIGEIEQVLAFEDLMARHAETDWLINETRLYWKRTLSRLDMTSRSLIALIEPGSCFGGVLLEVALACDRQYMFAGSLKPDDGATRSAQIVLKEWSNFGAFRMANALTRLQSRFCGSEGQVARVRAEADRPLTGGEALDLGLVTFAPDEIDWDEEVRIALEERASLSPDALIGLEANLRFVGPETTESKIFGRLSAWQNWIFVRPNASGEEGALRRYGTGQRPRFNRKRV